jgi:hypothetical protein
MESCFQRAFVGSATDCKTDSSGAWPAYQHADSAGEPSFRLSTAASFHDDSLVPPHPSQRSALPPQAQFGNARFPVIMTQDPRASSQVNTYINVAEYCSSLNVLPVDCSTIAMLADADWQLGQLAWTRSSCKEPEHVYMWIIMSLRAVAGCRWSGRILGAMFPSTYPYLWRQTPLWGACAT